MEVYLAGILFGWSSTFAGRQIMLYDLAKILNLFSETTLHV